MAFRKRNIVYILLAIILLLIGIRLILPYGIKWYLNTQVLNDMETYRGRIADVDLELWRGAYTIDSLIFEKIDTDIEEPFIQVRKMDLSIQWDAIWAGEIVGEVICYNPALHFSFGEEEEDTQTGVEEDWTKVVKDLIPIRINRFEMQAGKISLTNILTQPATDLPLESFNLKILNIQNVIEQEQALPSTIEATGSAPNYGGQLSLKAEAMLLKQVPDFDYDLSFENLNLTTLNPIIKYYSGMDVEAGTISMYSEMAMKDQKYNGYVKPLVRDMKIFTWKEEDRPFKQWLKEFLGEGLQELFENQRLQQFATKVPFEGEFETVQTDIWMTILNALKNAYIKAFDYELDRSIDFGNVDFNTKKE